MKNLKSNFLMKCVAVILVCVSVTTMAFSAVCVIFGVMTGAFKPEAERVEARQEVMEEWLMRVTNHIGTSIELFEKGDYENGRFHEGSENIMYEIHDEKGQLVHSTLDGSEYQMKVENAYTFYWPAEYKWEGQYTDPYEQSDDTYYDEYETSYQAEDTTKPVLIEEASQEDFFVTTYVKKNLTEKDGFYTFGTFFDFVSRNKTNFAIILIVSCIIALVSFVFLMCASGHKDDEEGIHISRFDEFPFGIIAVLFGGTGFGLLWGSFLFYHEAFFNSFYQYDTSSMFETYSLFKITELFFIVSTVISVFLLTMLSMTLAVRLKTKTFLKTTFFGKIIKWIKKIFSFFFRTAKKLPLVWKTILITGIIATVFFVCLVGTYLTPLFAVFGILFTIACSVLLILVSVMLKTIQTGTKEIVNGNTGKKIDTKYMIGDVKNHADNINSINDGIARAVEQRMKSERFKTELITNVSHDIKTPLTSIINYVDLLEKEDIDNEKAQEYIEVLSRQSTRLKKLIEDLIEASKASTGNLTVNLSKFEIGILLSQALGEYEEKLKSADLEIVLNKSEDMHFIMADSRHMWRIFDNVLNNITKYAMPHTRVYIDVKRIGRNVEIQFKNISKEQLNISGDELMERFVRGDSSRNTEGSGLGLSIAKNLAQLQKGSFNIQIDGDLFKIKLTLPLSE